MKNHFFQVGRNLKSRDGVTILEGLIALGLLATIAVGILGVLLSVSRKNIRPDIREEMVLAVEKAHEKLQLYTALNANEDVPSGYPQGLCENDAADAQPLSTSSAHDIACMLPAICDRNNSSFSYTVFERDSLFTLPTGISLGCSFDDASVPLMGPDDQSCYENRHDADSLAKARKLLEIDFHIKCNGFTL